MTAIATSPESWSLPIYAKAMATAFVNDMSPVMISKKRRLCSRAEEYMDIEAMEDSLESESEEDYSSDAMNMVDVVGSN